ncbi:MAG TPA: twin-arginine translocase TatA/TatE family subunit [Kofleriaceae bacterium]|nr:twin-arginine translocase TatA/TatE family subunit [Kofleriaceae bacterium]
MFGIGGSEILVILIVALLFLGPDKLPEVTKQISKGIRDLEKQSRVLQQTIENDEHIGGAIRDLKSALRGDEIQPRPIKKKIVEAESTENTILGNKPAELAPAEAKADAADAAKTPDVATDVINQAAAAHEPHADAPASAAAPVSPRMPSLVGEPDSESFHLKGTLEADELAALIKKPPGETAARGQAETVSASDDTKLKHG